jgi:hypothetical protein
MGILRAGGIGGARVGAGGKSMDRRNSSLVESWNPTSEMRELILRDIFLVGRDSVDEFELFLATADFHMFAALVLFGVVGD